MLTNYTVFGMKDGKAEVIDRCVTSMAANNLVKECKELYPNFESFGYVKGNFSEITRPDLMYTKLPKRFKK